VGGALHSQAISGKAGEVVNSAPSVEVFPDRVRCSCGWQWVYKRDRDHGPGNREFTAERIGQLAEVYGEQHLEIVHGQASDVR
jgi:hypothetical protein